jgi:hypothetical protein
MGNKTITPEVTGHIYDGKQLKHYFWICVQGYDYEGIEITTGEMFLNSGRPIQNKAWRRATQQEVDNMKWHKGKYYNLNLNS